MEKNSKILIIGNGFGGVYSLISLHKCLHRDSRIELTMVGEKNYFLFTPLLHEVATGGINPKNIIEPIRKIIKCCAFKFYLGKAENINLLDHTVKTGTDVISYDYLILASGAKTNFYNIPGASEHSFTLKSIDDAIRLKNHCIAQIERASRTEDRQKRREILRFVVVGAGSTGVELAAELQEFIQETFSHYYSREIIEDASITLVERGPELLSSFGKKMREESLRILRRKGIKVMLDTKVRGVGKKQITFDNDITIPTETIVWVAGIKPADLNFDLPVVKSSNGKMIVNEYLQLENYPEVFALGDIASFMQKGAPIPALAQVAEKEARAVAKNIKLLIEGKNPKKFVYHHTGDMVSLGRWRAVGKISNFTFSGRLAWWIWRTVYLSKLISFRKKVEVAADWTMNLFSPRDISQF